MTTADRTLETIRTFHGELTEIRHDLHAHPELGLETARTADVVARQLEAWGIEVHRGVGGHGVVGVLRRGNGPRAIGLRADMDALPIEEANDVPYKSRASGRMHACGHDGHTTMLLGAARYLAQSRDFNGTVNFIFQPGEEGAGGALAMLGDGLFDRFPCDVIYGMHNRPGAPLGHYSIAPGIGMSAGAFFDIDITGNGSHGARPEASADPVLAACHIGAALQSIVARNVPPLDMGVVSVTQIHTGDAYNVIPQTARMGGTVRTLRRETMQLIEQAMHRVIDGVASGMGVKAKLDFRLIFAPLVNEPRAAKAIADCAAELVGEEKVNRRAAPATGSEDFSFMLEKVPGAYIDLGNGEASAPLHNPAYNFNDAAIPYGAALYARIVEHELQLQPGAN